MKLATLPNYERAYVVSDLHLGGESGFQMFSEGEAFKKFCANIAKDTKAESPTLLLINGDFVDFLAEAGATYWNGAQASTFLEDISKRREFSPVFEGLQTFAAKAGAHLVFTLGNHELELTLDDLRVELVRILTKGMESRRSRVEFAFDGWGYRFRVGNTVALAIHGNEVDEYNFTRYDVLNQIRHEEAIFGISQSAQGWKPNAGTVFVIDAINRIKQQFPFVDILKPEFPITFLALTVLDPRILAVAEDVGRLKAAAIRNEASRPSSERRFLGAEGPGDPLPVALGKAMGPEAKIYLLEKKISRYIHDRSLHIDNLIYGSNDDAVLGLEDWVHVAQSTIATLIEKSTGSVSRASHWVLDRTSEAAKWAHAVALRTAILPFVKTDDFDVRALSSKDLELDKTISDNYDVVFAGHSHIRRFCPRGPQKRGHFVNTGTWGALMRLSPQDLQSDAAFRSVYDLLSDNRQALIDSALVCQERPVAILEQLKEETRLKLCRVDNDGKPAPDLTGTVYQTVLAAAEQRNAI